MENPETKKQKRFQKPTNYTIPNYKLNDCEFNLARMEIHCIRKALDIAVHTEEAADILGISEKSLKQKIIQYKLTDLYHHIERMVNGLKKKGVL